MTAPNPEGDAEARRRLVKWANGELLLMPTTVAKLIKDVCAAPAALQPSPAAPSMLPDNGVTMGNDWQRRMVSPAAADWNEMAEAAERQPQEMLSILRAMPSAQSLFVWADGSYRIAPSLDLATAKAEEGALIAAIPISEILAALPPVSGGGLEPLGRTLYEAFWRRNGGNEPAWCDQASAIRLMWDGIADDAREALYARQQAAPGRERGE